MLDYTKIKIIDHDQINRIWNHSDLIYRSEHNYLDKETGELKTVTIKTYLNITFTRYDKRLEIDGSLHKLYNLGLHNANDFSVSDCIKTIDRLCKQFDIDPVLCNVIGLEFGVNVTAPTNVADLVKWLRFHHRNQFNKLPELDQCYFAGTGYFGVKAYNKTIQYPEYSQPNLFRFEGKTRQSKYLNSKGIKTLKDLMFPTTYKLFSDIILAEWGSVLIFDKRTKRGVKFCNTDLWLEIKGSNHRHTFRNKRNSYYKLLGKNGLQNLTSIEIEKKLNVLNDCTVSTISESECLVKSSHENTIKTQDSIIRFPTIVKVENDQQTDPIVSRICLVTG